MAWSIARLPGGPPQGGDGVWPSEVHRFAVEECRLQVMLFWSRTQYMLVFNTVVFLAGRAAASRPGRGAALVFLLGGVACLLSLLMIRTQQGYYRAARDRIRRFEQAACVQTKPPTDRTSTLSGPDRKVSITQLVYLLLAAVALADLGGAAIVVAR